MNDCPGRTENIQLLDEYQQKDNSIKIIFNEINIGLTRSLNKALAIAQGMYIARML
ncbi:MAG: glycosyltransferase [Bacteroidaceae bacterium]|nr:glycosyltransferase [Bacteroidaceae bacterium]